MVLSPKYSWIDDKAIFRNIKKGDTPRVNFCRSFEGTTRKLARPDTHKMGDIITAEFVIRSCGSAARPMSPGLIPEIPRHQMSPMSQQQIQRNQMNSNPNFPISSPRKLVVNTMNTATNMSRTASQSKQNSTQSINNMNQQNQNVVHQTCGGFGTRSEQNVSNAPNAPSHHSTNSTVPPAYPTYPTSMNDNGDSSGKVLQSPYGFVNTPNGMVPMTWDEIKRQSLLIPTNALSHKVRN